ncbi:MAG: hydrogenase 2 small subunit [Methanocella sp. PtaU1.Bin125]|nr:MAG: hydrogenase 2 small subunit [Methanocella sp. PtaU1.Bin125]
MYTISKTMVTGFALGDGMDTERQKDGSGLPAFGRRTFLTMAAAAGAAVFLASHAPAVAAAVADADKKILWLRGAGCGGCTASFLNGGNPDILAAIENIRIELSYHDGLMGQQGIFIDEKQGNTERFNSIARMDNLINAGGYLLVVEGAIPNGPDGSGKYGVIGSRIRNGQIESLTMKTAFRDAAENADAILAIGTCAAFGGISAAGGSATDARGVAYTGSSRFKGIMGELGMKKDVINVPGCPPHPDWLLLTIADMVTGAPIETDDYRRPAAFFREAVHTSCPRRGYYDDARRDGSLAEGRCLYNLGCKGPVAYADCPVRRWNAGASMCTQTGGPCIACVEPEFPDAFSPFFSRIEDRNLLGGINIDTGAKIILGGAVLGAGIHAVKRIAIGDSDREEEPPKEKGKRGL